MAEKLLSVGQVADLLGLKTGTIRAWLAQRRLPVVHVGRSVRVPTEAVEEFIRRNTIPAQESRRGR